MSKEKWLDEVKKLPSNSRWNEFLTAYGNACGALNKYCSAKSLNALKMAGERLVNAAKNMYAEDSEKYQVLQM